MPVELNRIYRHRGELVTREILGETIVVPIAGELANMDDIFSLNDSGAYVWGALDGTRTLKTIRDGLTEQFDVEAHTAEADLRELVETLIAADLVELAACEQVLAAHPTHAIGFSLDAPRARAALEALRHGR